MSSIPDVTETAAQRWGVSPVGRVAAPVKEQVVTAIRDAILDFKLRPGDRLVEREIIESMEVSRATVREAISVLASEGLVTVVPQKGAHVTQPSLEDAEDLYEVRASLESLVVRRFIDRATDVDVAHLVATVDRMAERLDEPPTIVDFLKAKDEFYDVLLAGARSASLTQLLGSIQARVRLLRVTSLSTADRLPHVVTEMREIVEAIEARNPDRAARLMAEHIHMASRLALRALRAQG
ncbi:type I secretion C-terminal target domain (VC_A0849 subclass) [Agrococcus jejuensis]|uniref:Type I secretion C-terminal target domain (VC_A0849 subclass) n=1 Tax=Agrococcus jejuensis TaxID=399736 RepID=A0A1G8CAU4_9MICO|nr:type I secretion C-terminal target domain (VC_A0849 subclass) [Agrococcus jejuensis]